MKKALFLICLISIQLYGSLSLAAEVLKVPAGVVCVSHKSTFGEVLGRLLNAKMLSANKIGYMSLEMNSPNGLPIVVAAPFSLSAPSVSVALERDSYENPNWVSVYTACMTVTNTSH